MAALVASAVAGCGGDGGSGSKANLAYRPKDVYGELAARAAEAPCGDPAGLPPVPAASGEAEPGADVVFYFAHPEDETLFAPGTLDTLARAKKSVTVVYLSHGEGGRLLERAADGQLVEKTGMSPAQVAEVRDHEVARVMKTLGVEFDRLYPASVGADFAEQDVAGLGRATHACKATYERWHEILPDGLGGLMKTLVLDIQKRRPRVIVTHDARDDEDFLDHGHHKALGALVEIAARAAADPKIGGGEPWVVEELDTVAPKQANADMTFELGSGVRKKLMIEHASQFDLQKLSEVGQRTSERFVVRWRAKGAAAPPEPSRLASYVHGK